MSNTIEIHDITPSEPAANLLQNPVELEAEEVPVEIAVKPKAKRVARAKAAPAYDGEAAPKAKRIPRKKSFVAEDAPTPVEVPPPPPPLVREPSIVPVEAKKPRAKRAPVKPRVVMETYAPVIDPPALSEDNIQLLLAQHLMGMRARKSDLKQQRIELMVAGKIA